MRPSAIFQMVLYTVLLLQPTSSLSFETDQYNLPPAPLADIGLEVSEYTKENVLKATVKVNAEILFLHRCLEKNAETATKCGSRQKTLSRLDYLRSEETIALEVFRLLGAGFIATTKSGTWMDSHKFVRQPARYKTGYQSSIFVVVPTNYLTISPTVNLFGTQFGTDKIAHFFQQGYTYYKIYNKALAKGSIPDEAARKAVNWGQTSEHTFFGTMVSGVFSNADLYANYVGMKFYQGLTQKVKIGESERTPILSVKDGVWVFNDIAHLHEFLIKPFLTDHLNEAFNPSIFVVGLRSYVRKIVKKRSCPAWRKSFPDLSQADLITRSKALMLWNGEDYGFKSSKKFVTIANTCFGPATKSQDHLPTSSLTNSPAS